MTHHSVTGVVPGASSPQPAVIEAAYAACEMITRRRARNFYYGLKLTPPSKRGAMYAVYAWMRHADDLADADGLVPAERLRRIDTVRERTLRLFTGELPADAGADPTWIAMADTVQRHQLAVGPFLDMLEGQREDVEGRTYESFEELRGFCYRVASTVGLVCIAIWGLSPAPPPRAQPVLSRVEGGEGLPRASSRGPERSEPGEGLRHDRSPLALIRPFGPPSPEAGEGRKGDRSLRLAAPFAIDRGIAFQLTNILRDFREDYERGRVYLPREDFVRHGITPEDLVSWRDPARCEAFMREQVARAEAHYARSAPLDELIDPACRPTLWAMTRIYHGILARIDAAPCRIVGRRRIRLSSLSKAIIAFRARWLATSAQRGLESRSDGPTLHATSPHAAGLGSSARGSDVDRAQGGAGAFEPRATTALSQGLRR